MTDALNSANTLMFKNEAEFEEALITSLTERHGWSPRVLEYPTAQNLLDNWADIIFSHNQEQTRLNGVPLSENEKKQVLQKLALQSSPAEVQRLIASGRIQIYRDNPQDPRNHGKLIYLKIFDPNPVGGGDSTYQIARQPQFHKTNPVDKNRRGDFILLVWGLPVIHIELKTESGSTNEATQQILKYMDQGAFTGIFKAIQVFVAMTPKDMRYFANPGHVKAYSDTSSFTWTKPDNEFYLDWHGIARDFLGIPHSHKLIGDYLVADKGDGVLKVMRPYQIHAVEQIRSRIYKINKMHRDRWTRNTQKGGHIWHTTGSGKTLTSFKAAQLLARSGWVDKVVWVLDRVELGDQSHKEYSNFAGVKTTISRPKHAGQLLSELKSDEPLIVTSLHKLDILCNEDSDVIEAEFNKIRKHKMLFIVDEAHRTTFGSMFAGVKSRFPHAVFIGFTGTPIHEINQQKDTTTVDLFGEVLHKYSIYYGLRDENVLAFDSIAVPTFQDAELREKVALKKAGAFSASEVMANPKMLAIYNKYKDPNKVPMAAPMGEDGPIGEGIEELAGSATWNQHVHREQVVKHIVKHWDEKSRGGKLHALLAASSVVEAIAYYDLFKGLSNLKVTAVFTDADDNSKDTVARAAGIHKILTDYNAMFNMSCSREEFDAFGKDVRARLAHKDQYKYIDDDKSKQLDLVIVVRQMLTGYDSKWLNTLYLDRELEFHDLVQAFSRTNRVFKPSLKPFGTVAYFRKIHSMQRNIKAAFDLYAGLDADKVFVDPLSGTLKAVNREFEAIEALFADHGIVNFEQLPKDTEARKVFALGFSRLNRKIGSALIQGFVWTKKYYFFKDEDVKRVHVKLDKETYNALLTRYSELEPSTSEILPSVPLDLDCLAVARDPQRIDRDYMNNRFDKLREALKGDAVSSTEQDKLLSQVQKAYSTLSRELQEVAEVVISDLLNGKFDLSADKTFQEYLDEYLSDAQSQTVEQLSAVTGVVPKHIFHLMQFNDGKMESLNQFGRFDKVRSQVDLQLFGQWMKDTRGLELKMFDLNDAADKMLRDFFLSGGFDPAQWDASEFNF